MPTRAIPDPPVPSEATCQKDICIMTMIARLAAILLACLTLASALEATNLTSPNGGCPSLVGAGVVIDYKPRSPAALKWHVSDDPLISL